MTEPTTSFLNVDLELTSDQPLTALTDVLAPAMFLLHSTDESPYRANLELEGMDAPSLAITVERILAILESLSDDARAAWDAATARVLHVGIQSGLQPHAMTFALPAQVLARIASLNAAITTTVYGAAETNAATSAKSTDPTG